MCDGPGTGHLHLNASHDVLSAERTCACGTQAIAISLEFHQRDALLEQPWAPHYRPEFGPLEQIREFAPHLLG